MSVAGALAVATIMLASTADFIFPVKFRVDADGVECSTVFKRTTIQWSQVRRCYLDDEGVKLSPLAQASRLEAFRGVYLRFNNNRDEVVESVKRLRGAACSD
jgi:hypothetical protein